MPSLPCAFAPALPLCTSTRRLLPAPTRASPRRRLHASATRPRPAPSSSAKPDAAHPLALALRDAPSNPGVYRFLDASGSPLYIGKAARLRTRLASYLRPDSAAASGVRAVAALPPRLHAMLSRAVSLDLIVTNTTAAALALEASLVRTSRPRYNVLLKDDRSHPYIRVSRSQPYPAITLSRSRRGPKADRLYGPYVDAAAARTRLAALHAALPLRQRPRPLFRDRPCINYDMGRCPGVCQQLVSEDDYARTVGRAERLLAGHAHSVLADLRAEMLVLSHAMLYRRAAEVRDRIATLERAFCAGAGPRADDAVADAAVVVSPDAHATRDVLAAAASRDVVKVVLLQVRAGTVVNRLVFSAAPPDAVATDPDTVTDTQAEHSAADALAAVAAAHYASAPDAVPPHVVCSPRPRDAPSLAAALSALRGSRVRVSAPGARTAGVAALARRNAAHELGLATRCAADVDAELADLWNLLQRRGHASGDSGGGTGTDDWDWDEAGDGEEATQRQDHEARAADETNTDRSLSDADATFRGPDAPDSRDGQHGVPGLNGPVLNSVTRVECVDVSHTNGVMAVAAFSAFERSAAGAAWPTPRTFTLSATASARGRPDDVASVREAVGLRAAAGDLPDILLVDGGLGQLGAAADALANAGVRDRVALGALAKREEAIFVHGCSGAVNRSSDGSCRTDGGVRLAIALRDAAHSAALGAHRRKRETAAVKSRLDEVGGLGTAKQQALLAAFGGSVDTVAAARVSELTEVRGIGAKLAERIVRHFESERSDTVQLGAREDDDGDNGGGNTDGDNKN